MSNNKPEIVVLSRNYSNALGVVRALGCAGYDVNLIAIVNKKGSSVICSSSKYVKKAAEFSFFDIQNNESDKLIDLIISSADKEGKAVLFPTDDFTASFIDHNRNKLEHRFLMPHVNDSEVTMTDLMDKSTQTKLAQAAGLSTPRQWIVSVRGNVKVPDDMVYPCFVKPLQSISGAKTEMAKIDDEKALMAHLKKMQQSFADRDVLIQEFLNIEQEYDLSGLCMGSKAYIPGIIRKTHVAQHAKGVTMSGVMEPCSIIGENYSRIVRFLESMNFIGMIDMELNQAGGRLYFGEVNLRSGGPNYAYMKSGVNIPAMFVGFVNGEEIRTDDMPSAEYGKSFVYEKVAWEDYIYGHMSKGEFSDVLTHADFCLLNDGTDPQPGKVFEKKIRLSAVKHKVLDLVKKR